MRRRNMIEILWFRLLNPAAVGSYCWGASTYRTGQRLPRKCATFNYRVDMDSLFTVPYDRNSTPLLTKRRSMHTLGRQAAKIMRFSSIISSQFRQNSLVCGVIDRFQIRFGLDRKMNKLITKFFPLLLLATKSIIRFIVVIEQFGLWRYASFSDALTMRWKKKKLVTKIFPLLLLAAKIM